MVGCVLLICVINMLLQMLCINCSVCCQPLSTKYLKAKKGSKRMSIGRSNRENNFHFNHGIRLMLLKYVNFIFTLIFKLFFIPDDKFLNYFREIYYAWFTFSYVKHTFFRIYVQWFYPKNKISSSWTRRAKRVAFEARIRKHKCSNGSKVRLERVALCHEVVGMLEVSVKSET